MMLFRNQALHEVNILFHVDERPVSAVHDLFISTCIAQPRAEQRKISAVFFKQFIQIKQSFKQTGQIGKDIGIFLQHSGGVWQPWIAEVAHDKPRLGKLCGGFIDSERVTVL